jgi:hypothetical protein
MGRAMDYLRRAEEAEAQAALLPESDLKQQFLRVAAQWRVLARQAARKGL